MTFNTDISKIKNVLIIDDDHMHLFLSQRIMEQCEFSENIHTSKSCAEALKYLTTECTSIDDFPDFIFLDLFMPIQNGHDFIDAYIKKSKIKKNKCKLIILSVLINEDEIQQLSRNQDVYTLLQKPLTKESLSALTELNQIPAKSFHKLTKRQ